MPLRRSWGYRRCRFCISMNKITSFDDLPITLRAEDVAKILGVSRANAYVIMHSKGFPKMQIGKRIMVTKDNLRLWMEKQTSK